MLLASADQVAALGHLLQHVVLDAYGYFCFHFTERGTQWRAMWVGWVSDTTHFLLFCLPIMCFVADSFLPTSLYPSNPVGRGLHPVRGP